MSCKYCGDRSYDWCCPSCYEIFEEDTGDISSDEDSGYFEDDDSSEEDEDYGV